MKIAIAGCAGKMGRLLVREVMANGHELVAGTVSPRSGLDGHDLYDLIGGSGGKAKVTATTDPASLFAADVVIDFTTPALSRRHAELAAIHGKPLVIGTTGLDEQAEQAILAAGQVVPILRAANFSRGVVLLEQLVAQAARVLGTEADIEILEMHHRQKVDAPSGTALSLGRAAATARRQNLDIVGKTARNGRRTAGDIGFASLRGGTVIGEHTVMLALDGERLELGHRAENRSVFAKGAIHAGVWLVGREPGLYSMHDVLGLSPLPK